MAEKSDSKGEKNITIEPKRPVGSLITCSERKQNGAGDGKKRPTHSFYQLP